MDVSTLTDEELNNLDGAVAAEQQRRTRDNQLKDAAWSLVMNAKNAGYTKGQVANYLTQVVTQAYGEPV